MKSGLEHSAAVAYLEKLEDMMCALEKEDDYKLITLKSFKMLAKITYFLLVQYVRS